MSAANCPETPRQKMISMMYIVLTAMLALNVSTDVLNGFTLVQESLNKTIESTQQKNTALYGQFKSDRDMNPMKADAKYQEALNVQKKTQELYAEIETLKQEIAIAADGEGADPNNIQNRDNLDVSAQIALDSTKPTKEQKGIILKDHINAYAAEMVALVKQDTAMVAAIKKTFNTEDKVVNGEKQSWESARFNSMPVSASITLLTKIQADLRNTEADVVNYLRKQIDAGDFRVNKITAEVIPVSSYVTRGGSYQARIILAAIDSTMTPAVTVNNNNVPNGNYEVKCDKVGTFDIAGEIVLTKQDGSTQSYPFKSEYIVGEPTAIVSADMMNVFYAGIENPISVSVPGVAAQNISISATNAKLTKTAKGWSIKPIKVGQDCKITVSAKDAEGKYKAVGGAKPFRVKALPAPTAYISFQKDGREQKYRGQGKPISKANLVSAPGVRAELADADLDVKYRVTGFDITTFDSMGNALIKPSDGAKFSSEQKAMINKLGKGKKFFISRIRAVGPDGIENVLPAIDVSIN